MVKTKVEEGDSTLTLTTIIPSLLWKEPEYFVMTKSIFYDREDITDINIT